MVGRDCGAEDACGVNGGFEPNPTTSAVVAFSSLGNQN